MSLNISSPESSIRIGSRVIGRDRPCFVIAEIGNNHNGNFDRAIALIDAAKAAGADCAKFQMRKLDEVYRGRSLVSNGDDLSVEYTLELLRRFELSTESHLELLKYCTQQEILYLCTPWDSTSVRVLDEFGVEAFKVASADLTNLPLQAAIVATGKPLIVSTGMSTIAEIEASAAFLRERSGDFVLLHCQSTYPAAFHNIHLRFMERLRVIHPLVGYSGHERGIAVSLAALALGACVVERHITLDRTMEGPDHAASLEVAEFTALVNGIREIELARGPVEPLDERSLSQGELINRETLAKSLVAARDLMEGAVLTVDDIAVRSPGQGLSPMKLSGLLGRRAARSMKTDDYFFMSDLENNVGEVRRYKFLRPWGVPVRYHDAVRFIERSRPDLVEFHLSYQDMERDPAQYLSGTYDVDFVVHAPELFAGSRLMDLTAADENHRRFSIVETQRVIEVTRSLKRFFPRTNRPCIVANVGGFSMDAPFPASARPAHYKAFAEALTELDVEGIELLPQTMAPFPWHFGGQRFQNIFILPEEIADVCGRLGIRMCVDISHTKLASNYFGFDFLEGIALIGPYTAHYHLGDAKGLDGEGLQIGEGEIDFKALGEVLRRSAPRASFIPEIWQGHKDSGGGFWTALERLENLL